MTTVWQRRFAVCDNSGGEKGNNLCSTVLWFVPSADLVKLHEDDISRAQRLFVCCLYHHSNTNEESRFDLKDTIHDLLQKKSDIQIIFYVTLFLYISMFLHVNRNEVNNVIDTLHVTTDATLLYS